VKKIKAKFSHEIGVGDFVFFTSTARSSTPEIRIVLEIAKKGYFKPVKLLKRDGGKPTTQYGNFLIKLESSMVKYFLNDDEAFGKFNETREMILEELKKHQDE